MKRNLTNLKRKHYRALKRWMGKKKIDAVANCPWRKILTYRGCGCVGGELCKSIFPRLPRHSFDTWYNENYACPCRTYSYKYVRKVIRTILKAHND